MFCPACGTANSADSRFCGRCGAQVGGAPAAQAPIAQAPVAQAPVAQAPIAQAPIAQAPLPSNVAVPQKPTPSPFAAAPTSGILSTGVEPADSKLRTMMMRASGESSSASHAIPPQAQGPLPGDKPKDPKVSTGGARVPQRTVMGISMGAPPAPAGVSPSAPAAASHGGFSHGGFTDDEPTTRAHPSDLLAAKPAHILPPSPAAPSPAAPSAEPARPQQKTMLGLSGFGPMGGAPVGSPVVGAPLQPQHAAPQISAPVPQVSAPAPQVAAAIAPQPMTAAAPIAPAQPAAPPLHAQPLPPAQPAAHAQPPAQPFHHAAPQVASVASPQVSAPSPQVSAPSPQAAAPAPQPAMNVSTPGAPGAAAAKKLGPSHRTMLGVAAPAPGVAPGGVALGGGDVAPQSPIAPGAVTLGGTPGNAYGNVDTGEMSIAGMPSPRRRNTGCLIAVLASAILVASGALALFGYYHFYGRGPDVTASVVQTPAGEVVRIQIPGATEGTRVRYAGAERPVVSGAAELPLSADALRIGDNPLNIEIVSGNTTTNVPITLTVEYRVRADLAGLESTPAAMAVVVEAVPGSTVTLAGAAMPLDAQGRGRTEVPIASLTPGADGALAHNAAYVVTPPGGQPASGTLSTRIPIAALELRQPLDGAVTDRASVTVAGRTAAVAEGQNTTRVTIEGRDAPVAADGTFSLEIPLPDAAADGRAILHVVSRRPGSAPREVVVGVRRVPDLRRAASEVLVDRSLGYTQLAEQPDAARGRLVALDGQVYNADVQDGRGVLQMLVRGCTRADRCPLWVTYAPADPIEPGAVVRVVGVSGGTQQFRAESDETRTVPRIDATFVVPAS